MRTLVTGAGGFIGSHVCRALLERGDEPVALVRASTPRDRIADLLGSLEVVEADLTNEDATVEALRVSEPDNVIHTAWSVEPGSWSRVAGTHLAALGATLRLLRLAVEEDVRLVCAGSGLEDVPGAPPSVYVGSKRSQHSLVLSLAAAGAPVVCAHIFYLYGPWEDERRVVAQVVRSLLAGEEIELTDGRQLRDVLHVADVAHGLCTLATSDLTGGVDVCSGDATPLSDVFEAIGRQTGRASLMKVGARPWGPQDLPRVVGDPAPLRDVGFRPRLALDEGIAQTVAWWRGRLASSSLSKSR